MKKYIANIILFIKTQLGKILTVKTVYAIQWRHKTNRKCYHIPKDKNYVFTNYAEAKRCARQADIYWNVLEHFVASKKIYSSPLLRRTQALCRDIATAMKCNYRVLMNNIPLNKLPL